VAALVQERSGLARNRVGRVELAAGRAAVEVPAGWPERVARALHGAPLAGRPVRAWVEAAATSAASEDHFQRLARLLEIESQAEAERVRARSGRLSPADAERTGDSLVDLAIDDVSAGLGGRCLVALVKRNRTLALPWTRLDVGSPVLLAPHDPQSSLTWRGVVALRHSRAITVALADLPDELDDFDQFRLDLSADETARQRQRVALAQARSASGRTAQLRGVLLGEKPPQLHRPLQLTPLDAALNLSQWEAVGQALAAADLAIIHGPPGTGKTTTLVELVRQAVRQGQRVLACAPSNLAVDNLLSRLAAHRVPALRLGHPARVLPELQALTLDLLVAAHPDVRLAQRLVREALTLRRQAARRTRARPEPGLRAQLREDARARLADARRLERGAVDHLLDTTAVVCATLTGLDEALLGERQFDLTVLDEAGQATEPASWGAVLRSQKVILAGDPQQLPPTILSPQAADAGFGVSLLERATSLWPDAALLLDVQYRMHAAIMEFSNQQFYQGRLRADAAVAAQRLDELPGVAATELTTTPLTWIDTAGAGYDEELEPDGESRVNPAEAELTCRQVRALLTAGVSPGQVAVIAPYAAQVRLLRQRLQAEQVEVDSVDGFQGREQEAVVVSLTRSNPRGEVGFLADTRRMNVALTRARRKLILLGDSATLSHHPFYAALVDYCERQGAYRSVWDEPDLAL
jgi:predicted DNA helicase